MSLNPVEVDAEILPCLLNFCGSKLCGEVSTRSWKDILQEEPRILILTSENKPWRIVNMYDGLGIYALEDVADRQIVYIGFSFIPSETPFPTHRPFTGNLRLNGKVLRAGFRESDIPLNGAVYFMKSIGAVWQHLDDHSFIEINLVRTRGRTGKRTGPPVLASITYSFLAE